MPFYPAVVDALAMAHGQILEVKERLRIDRHLCPTMGRIIKERFPQRSRPNSKHCNEEVPL
jgi:hypothetical protein